ncbi:amino acid adenylation domain-containing protein [Desulfococcaceae bacterium HSG9]|nr:amino acid adenylation domain-containing protein [Desulfococcaceae bacterium HSG9]
MLVPAKEKQLVETWNTSLKRYPDDKCIHQLFEIQAEKTPDAIAVVYKNHQITYDELNNKANQLAHHLQTLGVKPDIVTGVCLERSVELIVGLLGILKAGGAYIPLDPAYPAARLQFMLEDARSSILITQSSLSAMFQLSESVHIVSIDTEEDWKSVVDHDAQNPSFDTVPQNLAYVLYTSGSTGQPKGVACHHAGVVNLLNDFENRQPIRPGDACSLWTVISFDVSVYEIWSTLLAGGCLHIAPDHIRSDPDLFLNWMSISQINSAYLPPFMLNALSDRQLSEPLPLRRLLVGVEPIAESLLAEIRTKTPGLCLINGYGPTEATICATLYSVPKQSDRSGNAPIGKPVQNMGVYVLDKFQKPTPHGIPGELYISGAGVANGYLNNPELTRERFIPNPLNNDMILYRTGDKVRYLPDGNLCFLGRFDYQVKLRGFRIESGEIENSLKTHPDILEAVVILRDDLQAGKGLVAYFVIAENSSPSSETLRKYLLEQLPTYMIPNAFVRLSALPQTLQGKIDRRALPAPPEAEQNAPIAVPCTPTEIQLADIWSKVLKIKGVSRNDNFFHIGGDSLRAVQIIVRVNKAMSIELPQQSLYHYPTIASLARYIETDHPKTASSVMIERHKLTKHFPLSYAQKGMWLFELLSPDTPVYHIALAYRLKGTLKIAVLERSFNEIILRHTPLRTVFTTENDKPVQIIKPPAPLQLHVENQRTIKPDQQGAAIKRWILSKACQPFDLKTGPLIRIALLRLADTDYILSVTLHHIASDGWSTGVLIKELNTLYTAFNSGHSSPLKELPVRYADFIMWQRKKIAASTGIQPDKAMEYWKKQLHDAPVQLKWPFDKPQSQKEPYQGAHYHIKFSKNLSQKIKIVTREFGVTLFITLLTIFKILLFRFTSQTDLITGTVLANRNKAEFEPLIGLFMNTLILRTDLSGNPSYRSLAGRVKKTVADAFTYSDIPFRKLVETIIPSDKRQSLIKVLFLMQTMDIPDINFPNIETVQLETDMGKAQVELRLELFDTSEGICGWFEYDTAIFDEAEISLMANYFQTSAERITESYDIRINELASTAIDSPAKFYPLSPMQQSMILNAISGAEEKGVYVQQVYFHLQERLSISAFQKSWEYLIKRHSILRTCFAYENLPEPLQSAVEQVRLPLTFQDWRDKSRSKQKQLLDDYLQADRERDFDITTPPLFRLALLRLSDNEYKFICTNHHAILDGRSKVVILQEFFTYYYAIKQNYFCELPPVQPFHNYINWIRQLHRPSSEQFWRKQLKGITAPVRLPFPERPNRSGYEEQHFVFDQRTTALINEFTGKHQITLNTIIQGAWALLLSRYSEEDDVIFGVIKSVRHCEPATPSSVGVYINTLPLRIRISPESDLISWLTYIRQQWIELRKYEHTQLSEIQSWSEVPGSASLFETYLMFDNAPREINVEIENDNPKCLKYKVIERTPLPLIVAAYGWEILKLSVEYERRRFDEATIRRMLGHLKTIIENIVEHPDCLLRDIPILTAAERHQQLTGWQPDPADNHPAICVHRLIEDKASETPDAVAVRFETIKLTYSDLNRRANQLAHYIRSLGMTEPEMKVGISLPRSADMIIGLLGILKAGGAYLPIDPSYPTERITFMLEDAQASLMLTNSELSSKMPDSSTHTVYLDTEWPRIALSKSENLTNKTLPENPAYIIYTSGSTGKPKGVMIEHRALYHFAQTAIDLYDLKSTDRVLQFASLSFDAAVEEIFPSLITGATLVLRTDEMLLTTTAFLQQCNDWSVTVLDLPTAFWHVLTGELDNTSLPDSIRTVIIGGEKARSDCLAKWQTHIASDVQLFNTYGPTETTVVATSCKLSADSATDEIPIGSPLPAVKTYVLDSELRLVPVGIPGELYIGGLQLARGYLNRSDLTVERFIPCDRINDLIRRSSTKTDGRLYKTGDRVRWRSDGQLMYIGRIDRQVKIRGFRVEPNEIEALLTKHPNIKDASVCIYEATPESIHLDAYIVSGSQEDETEISKKIWQWLKTRLPVYMVPSSLTVLKVPLPLTSNGKIDYKSLSSLKKERHEVEMSGCLPQDMLELQLIKLWEIVLKTYPVGTDDNFFDLGGNSLAAVILLNKIEKTFKKKLPPVTLYQAPSVTQFAAILRQENYEIAWKMIEPIQLHGIRPPFFFMGSIERAIALAPLLESDQPFFRLNVLGFKFREFQHKKNSSVKLREIAKQAHREIRAIQPEGPYFFGAFCRNAVLAIEIAQLLHADKQRVAFMGVFDLFWRRKSRCFDLERHYLNLSELGFKYITGKIKARINNFKERRFDARIRQRVKKFCQNTGKPIPHKLAGILLFEKINATFQLSAIKRYEGRITHFMASEWRVSHSPLLDSIATDGVEVHIIDGCHDNLFFEPQVIQLGRQLKICLDREQPDEHKTQRKN